MIGLEAAAVAVSAHFCILTYLEHTQNNDSIPFTDQRR